METIVVVGGGAGGLELATKLGNKLGKKNKAEIILIDRNHSHLWKPLLHEVATGALDTHDNEVNYLVHAKKHHFTFKLGALIDLDRSAKQIVLDELHTDDGQLIRPKLSIQYDKLIIAIGSITNDFGTQGAAEFTAFLDSPSQANRFQQRLLKKFTRLNDQPDGQLNIAIVGAGATGVELSAELFNTLELFSIYGLKNLSPSRLNVNLVEAGPRILPALSERIATSADQELQRLGVNIHKNTRIVSIDKTGLNTADNTRIDADLMVWAAGVKAPNWLKNIGGLESHRNNQLLVKTTLQTTLDDTIYAMGDCAACEYKEGKWVPPRAQSAHQMADCVYKNILRQRLGKKLLNYVYNDRGSLVNLSRYGAVGSLMGNLTKGSMFVEGSIARIMYISLYRMHQLALHGVWHTFLLVLSDRISKVIRPKLKLH